MGKGTLYSVKDKLFFCFLRSLVLKWVRCILMFLGLHHRSFNFWGRTKLKKISKRRRKSPVIVQSWRDCLLASHYTAFNWPCEARVDIEVYRNRLQSFCLLIIVLELDSFAQCRSFSFWDLSNRQRRRLTTCNDSHGLGERRGDRPRAMTQMDWTKTEK